MRVWQLIVVVTVILFGLIACDGMCVYTTCVDRVTPEIPGLIIEGGGTFREGIIYITNHTGQDLYLLHPNGQEIVQIESGSGTQYPGQGVAYYGPRPKEPGTVVSTWVVKGRVGDTPFEIHGRTVYKPRNGVCPP